MTQLCLGGVELALELSTPANSIPPRALTKARQSDGIALVLDLLSLEEAQIILTQPVIWGPVTAHFRQATPPQSLVSHVHLVPFAGEDCVLIETVESGWEMPGGTLDENEPVERGLQRELQEEAGASVESFEIFGSWECVTSDEKPYRPHIPHPRFHIALGWAEVVLTGSPQTGEGMETVLEVAKFPLDAAIDTFVQNGKPAFAALYLLAAELRKNTKS